METKWIFQKNVSSKNLIDAYLDVISDIESDETNVIEKLKEKNGYTGRSNGGSLNTIGVRYSQMCFYMFGYKNENRKF